MNSQQVRVGVGEVVVLALSEGLRGRLRRVHWAQPAEVTEHRVPEAEQIELRLRRPSQTGGTPGVYQQLGVNMG